jgi:hypothetical protein
MYITGQEARENENDVSDDCGCASLCDEHREEEGEGDESVAPNKEKEAEQPRMIHYEVLEIQSISDAVENRRGHNINN